MQLHQFLRYLHSSVPVIIFNLKGYQIAAVPTKENIDVDLYEYVILDINIGDSGYKWSKHAIYITLEK